MPEHRAAEQLHGGVLRRSRKRGQARGMRGLRDDPALGQVGSLLQPAAEGHAAALDELADPVTLDGFNLRLALLLDTGKIEEALNALSNPPEGSTFDAEARRLFAAQILLVLQE